MFYTNSTIACLFSLSLYSLCTFAAEHGADRPVPPFTIQDQNQQFRVKRWWEVMNARTLANHQNLTASEHADLAAELEENMSTELKRLQNIQAANNFYNLHFTLRRAPKAQSLPSFLTVAAADVELLTTMQIIQQRGIVTEFPPARTDTDDSLSVRPQPNISRRCRK